MWKLPLGLLLLRKPFDCITFMSANTGGKMWKVRDSRKMPDGATEGMRVVPEAKSLTLASSNSTRNSSRLNVAIVDLI